jgi:hypothetical protein
MKASFEYPSEQGVPTQLSYAAMQKEQQRQALARMHEHLSRQFPPVCPMALDGPQQAENHPVPVPAGIGKGDGVQLDLDAIAALPPTRASAPVAALKAEPEQDGLFMDADVYKGFKKQRKKLGKKVLSGSMTVDEARAKLGRQFAQKGAGDEQDAAIKAAGCTTEGVTKDGAVFVAPGDPNITPRQMMELQAHLTKAAGVQIVVLPPGSKASTGSLESVDAVLKAAAPVAAPFDPEVIKAAVADATTELKDLLVKQQETFTTKLAEQQKVIDAIADQPDPSTAAFSGLAFQPQVMKSRRPAAVPDIAESAARAQDMIRRNLQHTYQTHSDPHVREAAGQSLATMGAGMEAPPMT